MFIFVALIKKTLCNLSKLQLSKKSIQRPKLDVTHSTNNIKTFFSQKMKKKLVPCCCNSGPVCFDAFISFSGFLISIPGAVDGFRLFALSVCNKAFNSLCCSSRRWICVEYKLSCLDNIINDLEMTANIHPNTGRLSKKDIQSYLKPSCWSLITNETRGG